MRGLGCVVAAAVVACGHRAAVRVDAAVGHDGTAFEIVTTDVTIAPGAQDMYCYHFHTPAHAGPISRWVTDMNPGLEHAFVFIDTDPQPPPDGISPGDCSSSNRGTSYLIYATDIAHQETDLPSDDGSGVPLAQNIPPNTPGFIMLDYRNATTQPLVAHLDLQAYPPPPGSPFTQTDSYLAYLYNISIGPGATNVVTSASCPLPSGVKFWSMSTHTNKQSIATQVSDGANAIFTSTDWQHPAAMTWSTAPFYSFASPQLTWQCTYNNNAPPPYCDQSTDRAACSNADTTVVQGASPVTSEMCIAYGFFFPSTGPVFEVGLNGNCVQL
jgi:hypothetical protein